MDCLKGMMIGIVVGVAAGMVMGACNSTTICDAIKQGKKEIKRFKRKYM
ncbi:MAG: hypothetical protein IJ272_03440 [Clostridia bacterium]|nr:hypothetical protein [Clostridia bacterium]